MYGANILPLNMSQEQSDEVLNDARHFMADALGIDEDDDEKYIDHLTYALRN